MTFKTGDNITATYDGRTVVATVLLASPNGRSLMIGWDDGMLGGFVGKMPILQDERGDYRCLMDQKPVTLKASDA